MSRRAQARPTGSSSAAQGGAGEADERTGKPCPVCGKPGFRRHDPFCSQRCQDVDLNRWLGGVYGIPADDPLPEDEEG